jgi:hypothetical protein
LPGGRLHGNFPQMLQLKKIYGRENFVAVAVPLGKRLPMGLIFLKNSNILVIFFQACMGTISM